ncbi:DUF6318 family protein [Gleimia sp. 6138-11-ORH1]|uniref:DUF6318 family protein n=1 Tax=Gleimia sp. 6138-11-ORH1 TaxID=2973937 RepID=UPI0021685F02|nr:DUF6318 family protein [Gleimia sp. 6138-11-ORH1]MCS4485018.1 DUF6318 family protein [Gleimia sp. 6138-11-ORH1]
MSTRKLPLLIAISLMFAPALAACANDTTPSEQAPQAMSDNKPTETEAKNEPAADENGLIPTDDPNVFKATKILPRPPESAQYPKPEYPALGYENSIYGAEAVAIYFEDMVVHAYSTGDTTDFEAICTSAAEWCRRQLKGVKKVTETDTWYKFENAPEVTVTGYGVVPDDGPGEYSIRMETLIPASTYFNSQKMTFSKHPQDKVLRHIFLSYQDGRWVIVDLGSEVIP